MLVPISWITVLDAHSMVFDAHSKVQILSAAPDAHSMVFDATSLGMNMTLFGHLLLLHSWQ